MNSDLSNFIEKDFLSKRFVLATIILVAYLAHPSDVGAAIAGTVIGYYFGAHSGSGPGSSELPV